MALWKSRPRNPIVPMRRRRHRFHGAFSVNIAIAMQSDVAPPRSTLAVTDAAAEIAAGRAASAAAGDIGPRAAGANSPSDQTPDAAPWIAKAAAGKAGIANAGSGVEADSGAAAEPAAGGMTSAALNLASPSFSSAPARDAGGVSARTKRRTETDAAPAAVRGVNTSPSGSGEAASNVHSAAPLHTAVAGGPSPAFSGQAGVNFAADLASLSKSGPPARGAAWARPGGRLRSDGATPGSASDAAASQALTQTTSQVGGGAPLFSLLLPAGAASIPKLDGAPLGTPAATLLASDASPARTQSPTPMIGAVGANPARDQSPPAPSGDPTGFSSMESLSLPGGVPDATTEPGPVKVAALGRQMHFPPLAPPSPADQIANRIAAEVSPGAAGLAADAAGEETSGVASSVGAGEVQSQALSATRVLHLQLEPEGLGAVSIRMRLSGNRLDLQLEPDRADTMRRIDDNSGQLVEKLRAAGYVLDHLAVMVAEPHTAPTQQGSAAGESRVPESNGDAPVASPGMSQQGGSNADAGSGAQRDHAPSKMPAAAAEDRYFRRDDSGAVYL